MKTLLVQASLHGSKHNYNLYESNRLDDLKQLTSNYKSIKEYVFLFSEFDIIKEEYPHELKE